MGSYKYEAIDKMGETKTGRLEAEAQEKAVEKLRGMGLMVTEVKEIKESSLLKQFSIASKVKPGDLSLFSRQLSAMLNSGIPLTRSLYTLSKQATNPSLVKALTAVAQSVEGGVSLSEALKAYPEIFSELYVNMIDAGETGGTLESTLSRLSEQLQKDKELRDNIKLGHVLPDWRVGFCHYYPVCDVIFPGSDFHRVFSGGCYTTAADTDNYNGI